MPSVGASISETIEARKPASVLPAPVGATSSALRPARAAASISSWCRRGDQPLAANQSATTGGSASVGADRSGDAVISAASLFLFLAIDVARPALALVDD